MSDYAYTPPPVNHFEGPAYKDKVSRKANVTSLPANRYDWEPEKTKISRRAHHTPVPENKFGE